MKRLFAALVTMCLLLVGILGMNAYAESAATRVDLLCTLNTDGDCIVSAWKRPMRTSISRSLPTPRILP